MKTISLIQLGLVLAGALCVSSLQAATLTLNFSSAGGAILDTNGVGTGFTARMPGTGANITNNDPNLLLNTGGGVLQMHTSPGADFSGQVAMADATVVGINLSDLGFNGGNDFSATAAFVNITNLLLQPDQLCLVVGTASTNLIRAGFINFSAFHATNTDANEMFGVNTVDGSDLDGRFFGQTVGSNMTVNISRTSGAWSVTVNGVDRMPNTQANGTGTPIPPTFLDTETNLFVGLVAQDVGNDSPWTVNLDTFTVAVSGNSPPSISSQTQKQIVNEGNPASFSATISDTTKTPVSYQWYKDGVALPAKTGSSLSLFPVAADAGYYTVAVTNSLGSATSTPAPLSVILPAGALRLGFNTAGGGLTDTNGVGAGLPDRLPGTGGAYIGNDPNLFLDTNNGILNITSTTGDYNGGANEPTNESPGVSLARLGFTGSQDLNVSLVFPTLPATVSFDQAGVYVGQDTNYITRAGWIDFTAFSSPRGKEEYSENITPNGSGVPANGPGGHYFGFPFDPSILPCTVLISRTAGTWHYYIDGGSWDIFSQPTFLNAATNFTAGIFIYDTGGGAFTQSVSNFTARVFNGIRLNATLGSTNLTFCWNVAGPGGLHFNTNLTNAAGWLPVPGATNSPFVMPSSKVGQKFFRVSL